MEVEATWARGLLARCALTLSTGYLRNMTVEDVIPAEMEVPYTCGGNDAGRKGTGAKARNSSGQTNMTTVRISRTQDALLITIEAEHYEAMRARGAFLRAGKYLEPVGDSSIGTICWHGEGDTQQHELGTEQAMHDHPPGPHNSGSVTARGIYPNFPACLWQVYLCFRTTSCVDMSLEALQPSRQPAKMILNKSISGGCGAVRCGAAGGKDTYWTLNADRPWCLCSGSQLPVEHFDQAIARSSRGKSLCGQIDNVTVPCPA